MKAIKLFSVIALPLCLLHPLAHAERFDLETALIESASAKAVGGGKKSGDISTFFTAQKEMVYGALSDLGISLDSLPLDVRKNLERFQTTNFDAFKMFSLGLNAQDQGKFAEAKAFFQKAVEIDPNFELAGELGVAMPSSNIAQSVQLQAVLAAASRTANSDGKGLVEVDLSGAIAALLSGQTVVAAAKVDVAPASLNTQNPYNNTPNVPNVLSRKVVGVSYVQAQSTAPVSIAATNEWTTSQVSTDGAGLVRVGEAGAFLATRARATAQPGGSLTLPDGSAVSWGHWQSNSGSFTVAANGSAVADLGPQFQYLIGEATPVMPGSGTATYNPAGGPMVNVRGSIGVDFANRNVTLNNLGFDISGLNFRNMNGSATYSSSIASGFFKGNYSTGTCNGCAAFSPGASVFTGNFLGLGASGLMFSTVLSTGTGTVSGLHAFQNK